MVVSKYAVDSGNSQTLFVNFCKIANGRFLLKKEFWGGLAFLLIWTCRVESEFLLVKVEKKSFLF